MFPVLIVPVTVQVMKEKYKKNLRVEKLIPSIILLSAL
jgi:hypothetical protein